MTLSNEVTRLLSASTILLGESFRKTLFDHFAQQHIAAAPEIGVDMQQLMQVAAYGEAQERQRTAIRRRFGWLFLLLAAALLIVLSATGGNVLVLIVGLILAAVVQWFQNQAQRPHQPKRLADDFRYGRYDAERIAGLTGGAALEPEIHAGMPVSGQNVVVYKGFLPFVGAGIPMGRWSFATNITYGKEDGLGGVQTPQPFSVPELYAHIEAALKALGIPDLFIEDRLYVNGQDIREDRSLLPDRFGRPTQVVDAATIQAAMVNPGSKVRHYQWIHVHYAADMMILSFFLRLSLSGNNLFIELSRFLLTPPADVYRQLDTQRTPEERWVWLKHGLAALGLAPISLIGGLLLPLEYPGEWWQRWMEGRAKYRAEKELCKEIEENPRYDWGTDASIRALVSSQRYEHYFQQLDKEMYDRIVERTILDGVIEFLDKRQISTADFKERRTTILNTGIIVQGGNVEAQAIAVGEGAQATQTTTGAPTGGKAGAA